MKGHIVTSEDQTELSVQDVLLNREFKDLRVLVDLGCQGSLWPTPMFFETESLKNMNPPNGGAYLKPITRRLCRGGGGEQMNVKIQVYGGCGW